MQEKPQRFAQGVIAALLGATLWGFSGSCAEFLLSSYEISSIFITMVRMLGASVLFIGYTMITQRGAIRRILSDKRTVGSLLVFGCIGLYLDQITYVIAIGYTNAGTATVLANVGLILIMLVTCFTARRLPYAGEFLGVICAFAAVMLIATKGDFGTLNLPAEGLFWGMMNAASLALYVMQPRKLFAQWGSLLITGLGMLFGGFAAMAVWVVSIVLAVLGIGPQTGDMALGALVPVLDASGIGMLVVIVVIGTFAAFGLYLHGVSVVGSMRGGLLGAIEPVSATLFSALWLGTAFTGADWAGLVLMVITIFLVTIQRGMKTAAAQG